MRNQNYSEVSSQEPVKDNFYQELGGGFGQGFWAWWFFKKWYPFNTIRSITICYLTLALVFLLAAILTGLVYLPLAQYKIIYANQKGCLQKVNEQADQSPIRYSSNVSHERCQVTFEITEDINAPVQVLYFIENIYLNHRLYLHSYSYQQLEGNQIDQKEASIKCNPFITNKDMNKTKSWSGKQLDPDALAYPCGFKAFLLFNDTFTLKKLGSGSEKTKSIQIDSSRISQVQGKGIDFKSRNPDQEWINPQDQHFQIWMLSQSLLTKIKLWGTINQDLKAGNYSLIAQNQYQINGMRINKGVQIAKSSLFGGKSYTVPSLFLIFSIACLIFAIVFIKRFNELGKTLEEQKKNS